jgi:hypothetical protein
VKAQRGHIGEARRAAMAARGVRGVGEGQAAAL